MNKNFESILWLSGHFGIVGREHIEKIVYRNKYSHISANRTLSKLEKEHGLLKRIDRGRNKPYAYKLTNKGMKDFISKYGYEPKNYNSGDKLNHQIQILNFYVKILEDMNERGLIENDYIIIEEKEKILFNVEKQLKYEEKGNIIKFVPDAFSIYRYDKNRAKPFYLEIENSNRNPKLVANKTLNNYEKYFISGNWKREEWQPKNRIIFPQILIVSYSEFKTMELIKAFNKKIKVKALQNSYLFSDYNSIKNHGISGEVWYKINGEKIQLFS